MAGIAAPKPVLGEYLLKDRLTRHPGGRYSYSNTGYEILTAIIEEQTGRPYEDYCGEAVFGKLGIAEPKLHPDWRMLSGAGGWFVPGPDYLAFLDIFDPAQSVSRRHRQSLDRPGADPMDARPTATAGTASASTPGPAPAAGRCRTAASCIRSGKNAEGEPTEGSIVSHAFRAADGTAVFIALEWSPDAQECRSNELAAARSAKPTSWSKRCRNGACPSRAALTFAAPLYINPAPGPRRVFGVGEFMTGSTRSSDGLDARRRRLLFRSWHRGTREADLIMGRFADVHIEGFSDAELDQYEHLLDAIETDLLAWMTGVADVPAEHDTAMFRRVRDFHLKAGRDRWRKCRPSPPPNCSHPTVR